MGAEMLAEKYRLAKDELDRFSLGSHQRGTAATQAGAFKAEIVPVEIEMDEHDAQCVHALAYDEKGRAIGTGRLLPDGHIGRMAVIREARGRGVGAALRVETAHQGECDHRRRRALADRLLDRPAAFAGVGHVRLHGVERAGLQSRPMSTRLWDRAAALVPTVTGRQAPEIVVHQRNGCAVDSYFTARRAHGDANVGGLQGRHVVHAVAGHGHEVAEALVGADQAELLLGHDAGEGIDDVVRRQQAHDEVRDGLAVQRVLDAIRGPLSGPEP